MTSSDAADKPKRPLARRIAHISGLTSHGFPNCFFLGFTQTAVTVNVPHALNEQAKHVAHILQTARDLGAPTVEPTARLKKITFKRSQNLPMWVRVFTQNVHLAITTARASAKTAAASFQTCTARGRLSSSRYLRIGVTRAVLRAWTYAKTAPLGSFKVARLQPNM